MKIFSTTFLFLLFFGSTSLAQNDEFHGEKIAFQSLDKMEITADLYVKDPEVKTYIILYHQANFSRGSYRTIAPKLNELGYNCLAVDARSGHKARGVLNETTKRAIKANEGIKFKDAVQDVDATFLYVRDELKAEKIIIWGSSYSAAIVIYMGSKYADGIDGILSFSPGEYFKIEGQEIGAFAENITCPVFITSAANEKKNWENIYNNISSEKDFFLPEEKGFHGSKALWPDKKGNEAYWEAVIAFLNKI